MPDKQLIIHIKEINRLYKELGNRMLQLSNFIKDHEDDCDTELVGAVYNNLYIVYKNFYSLVDNAIDCPYCMSRLNDSFQYLIDDINVDYD